MSRPASSPPRRADAVRLALTVAVLVAGEAVLWRTGSALPSPPFDGAGGVATIAEAEPLALGAGLIRLVALAAGAGLLSTTALGLAARCCRAARLVASLDRCTLPALRHLLDGAVGAGLAASIGLSALPAGAEPGGEPAPVTLRRLPDVPSTTLRRLPDAPPPDRPAATADRGRPAARPAPQVEPVAEAPAARRGEVVVRPGDSFWVLAERHEAERLGRRPSEAEVGRYWQQLVATNRHRLAVPGDADLLFPGQVLLIP